MKIKLEEHQLDELIRKLVREYGVKKVLQAVVVACDDSADFALLCNDKKAETSWRETAIDILDLIKRIRDNLA
jgi:hypothetical protein